MLIMKIKKIFYSLEISNIVYKNKLPWNNKKEKRLRGKATAVINLI